MERCFHGTYHSEKFHDKFPDKSLTGALRKRPGMSFFSRSRECAEKGFVRISSLLKGQSSGCRRGIFFICSMPVSAGILLTVSSRLHGRQVCFSRQCLSGQSLFLPRPRSRNRSGLSFRLHWRCPVHPKKRKAGSNPA